MVILFRIFNNVGSITFSTYFGGENDDALFSVHVDSEHNQFVICGTTNSDPVSALYYGGYGASDSYLVLFNYREYFTSEKNINEINCIDVSLVFATRFGGSGDDYIESCTISNKGYIYVTGETESPDFRLLNPIVSTPNSGSTGYIMAFSLTGERSMDL